MNVKPINSSSAGVATVSLNNNQNQVTTVSRTLQDDAAKVQLAQQAGAADPAKIEQLKAQVQSGTYNPSSTEIAKALARDLL